MIQKENYTIYNGDCINVMQELVDDGTKVDLVLTDPPYNTTNFKWDSMIPLDEMWGCIKQLRRCDSTPIVLFGFEPFSSLLRTSNMKEYRYDWIWDKKIPGSIGIAKYQPLRYHELISVFYKKAGQYFKQMVLRSEGGLKRNKYKPTGSVGLNAFGGGDKFGTDAIDQEMWKSDYKNPSTILEFPRVQSNSKEKVAHPTQKPVKLLEYLIKTYTLNGDTVLDFTMGSGSTGVACLNLGRKFIGIELEKEYFNIANQRLKETEHSKQTTLI